MIMRSTRCLSSDPYSYLWSLIFPCRPELTTVTLSRRTQRHSNADAPDRASKCIGSLSLIARNLTAIALFLLPTAAFFGVASPASAQNLSRAKSTDRLAKFIEEASDRFAVPAHWIRAVIQIESGGDEHAISPRGAMGLMQLMPGTWAELGVRYGLGLDPFDLRNNVFAGTAYLMEMHDRFG
jgi:soluble lytic murein transglycosylase-like protein